MGIKEIANSLLYESHQSLSCNYCAQLLAFDPMVDRSISCLHCRSGAKAALNAFVKWDKTDRAQNPISKLRPVPLDDETLEICPSETYRMFSGR